MILFWRHAQQQQRRETTTAGSCGPAITYHNSKAIWYKEHSSLKTFRT